MKTFKIGDRVKYTSDGWGDSDRNPLWNGKYGQVIGIIDEVDRHSSLETHVQWGNGTQNGYNNCDLELVSPPVMLPDSLFEV